MLTNKTVAIFWSWNYYLGIEKIWLEENSYHEIVLVKDFKKFFVHFHQNSNCLRSY